MLALPIFAVVSWRMPSLHTLRVLGGIWQGQELLLQLGGDVDTSEVGCLSSNADLLIGLVPEENALLLVALHTRDAARVAPCRVDCERSVDVTTSLVELDGLPGVLGRLADARSLHHGVVVHLSVVRRVLNVSLYLILTEPKRQVEFECLVVLARGRLLKARLVGISGGSRATLGRAARVLRSMVI